MLNLIFTTLVWKKELLSKKTSLLIITGDESRQQKINELFIDERVVSTCAKDSKEAINLLKRVNFDCIISDTLIGQLDGWRLARMLRANLFLADCSIPFILISDTHCEHIAETTAAAFDIDKVIPQQQLCDLTQLVFSLAQKHELNTNLMSVLIVEDDPDIAELAERILKHNYCIEVAETGTQGLMAYRNKPFDIVLLDVQLPELNGMEVLDKIIQQNPTQAVVMMTAHGDTDMAEQLMIKGAVDFISKPFKAEQLRKVISIAAHRENYLISHAQFAEKVTTIQTNEEKYRQLYKTHNRLLNHLSTVVMELDVKGRILFTNQAWTELTGFEEAESRGQFLHEFAQSSGIVAQTSNLVENSINNVIEGQVQSQDIEFQIQNKYGELLWVEVILNDITNDSEIVGVTATIDNINDRKKAQLELSYLASHDTLTGLFNRHYFDSQLIQLAGSALDNGLTHTLLYLDLDRFKIINDTQGHHQGDTVLKDVAASLTGLKRCADIVCRIGGDEFALLLPQTDKDTAISLAQFICDTLHNGHYQFGDSLFQISVSVGVAVIDGSELQPEIYLQHADIALYVAKKRGRNLVHVFSPDDKDSEDFQLSANWVQMLQKAIFDDQLVLHFQPVVHSSNQDVAYFEALVRLDIDGRLIFPGEFIPAIERAEDMTLLDHQVVSKAIYMMSVNEVLDKVAINLSAQAFGDERLLPLIQKLLNKYNVKAERIIFEVTESASLTNLAATQSMISKLMDLGCEFSIDDFGTGFSTFSYLKELPANCVKIDGSFVKDMLHNPIDMALVKAICDIAKALNKTTVAEFVENEATLIKLQDLGVDYLQGYHISRPQSIENIKVNF